MAAHDSQRLKARGMIQDPELKSMVGRKGIPKGQHGQAKVGNGQPPVPLAKGGSASKARDAMMAAAGDEGQDKALMKRHNRLMHPGQKSKLAKGGKPGCKMAAGGAAKTRRGIGHGKMPKKGHMAAYD